MNEPIGAREALLVEAIGEAARLIDSVAPLMATLQSLRQGIAEADAGLRQSLAEFEARVLAVTENAKRVTVRHIAVKADEATRRSIDQQSRAMADVARVALGAEVGAFMQRWQATLQPLLKLQQARRWEAWLTHAACAAVASAATWALTLYLWHG